MAERVWAGNLEAVVAEAVHLHRRRGDRARYGPSWADVDLARTIVATLRRVGVLRREQDVAAAAAVPSSTDGEVDE